MPKISIHTNQTAHSFGFFVKQEMITRKSNKKTKEFEFAHIKEKHEMYKYIALTKLTTNNWFLLLENKRISIHLIIYYIIL